MTVSVSHHWVIVQLQLQRRVPQHRRSVVAIELHHSIRLLLAASKLQHSIGDSRHLTCFPTLNLALQHMHMHAHSGVSVMIYTDGTLAAPAVRFLRSFDQDHIAMLLHALSSACNTNYCNESVHREGLGRMSSAAGRKLHHRWIGTEWRCA